MPFPNGVPTRDELEENARAALSSAESLIDDGDIDIAQLHIGRAQVYATLALGQRLEGISDGLPYAGRGV